MDAETLLLETEESMLKAVDFAKQEFSGVRTGKASPGLVENLDVHVSSYGSVMKLKGLAVIARRNPVSSSSSPLTRAPSTTSAAPSMKAS